MKKNIGPIILLSLCFYPAFTIAQSKTIDSLLSVLHDAREDTNKVNVLNNLSRQLEITAKYAEAKKYADDALLLAEKTGFKKGTANACNNIGNIYRGQGNYPEALKNHFASLKIREEIGDKNGIAASYYNIGYIYELQGNYSEALKSHLASLKIKEEIGNKRGAAISYIEIGKIYHNQSDYPEALKNHFISLKISEEIGDKSLITSNYGNIGNIYAEQGNYPEALKNYFASLKIYEEIGDKKGIAISYDNMGNVYDLQGNHPEALKKNLAALKISEEIGDKNLIASNYNNIGTIYGEQDNYPEALKHFLASLKISEEIGDKNLIASNYGNIGLVYHSQGDYPEALKNYFAALKISEEIGDKNLITTTNINIGRINIKLKKYIEANQFLNNGLSLSKEIGAKEFIKESYYGLAELDSTTGNWETAYKNYKLFIVYKDSLVNEENSKKTVQIQMQYEFDKKEDSLKQKQLVTEFGLSTQKKQKNFYLIGAVLFALLFLFVFLNFRNQRKVNRLANIAYAKEKAELELHSLRAQLNPHFMFNSLNAIQELILKEDFDNSHTYLARFAKLLRMLLENAETPFVSLNSEIDFLELYLSLEKLRIPDLRFSITVDPSINTGETLLPNMVLQPFIENALWHGLSQKSGDKNLELVIQRQNGAVIYNVKDNGVGRKKAAEFKSLYRKEHKSKGMELLTKRFKLLNEEFGSEIKTQVSDVMNNGEAGGTSVSITVPDSLAYHVVQES